MIVYRVNSLNAVNTLEIKAFKVLLIDAVINDFEFRFEVGAEIVESLEDVFGLNHVVGLYFLEKFIEQGLGGLDVFFDL